MPTDYRFTGERLEAALGLYAMGARWYDPALGRWLSADTIVPEPGNPQSLNRYTYGYGNPLKYRDPSGHWVETVWDVANIAWDIYEVRQDPSLLNIGCLVVDVAATVLPVVPAGAGLIVRGGKAAKIGIEAVTHADEVVDAAKVLSRVDGAVDAAEVAQRGLNAFSRAEEFGIRPWKELRRLTEGTDLKAHHLIEKRFVQKLGLKEGDIPSIALTAEEHQRFANAWRDAIGYIRDNSPISTENATKEHVWLAAQRDLC